MVKKIKLWRSSRILLVVWTVWLVWKTREFKSQENCLNKRHQLVWFMKQDMFTTKVMIISQIKQCYFGTKSYNHTLTVIFNLFCYVLLFLVPCFRVNFVHILQIKSNPQFHNWFYSKSNVVKPKTRRVNQAHVGCGLARAFVARFNYETNSWMIIFILRNLCNL